MDEIYGAVWPPAQGAIRPADLLSAVGSMWTVEDPPAHHKRRPCQSHVLSGAESVAYSLESEGIRVQQSAPLQGFHVVEAKGQHSAEETKFRGGRSVLERKRSESLVTGTAPLRAAEADVPMADWPAFDALREARRRLTSGARRQAGVPVASDPSVGQLMAHYPKYQEVAADVTQEDWQWSCLEVDKVPENPIVHSGKRH